MVVGFESASRSGWFSGQRDVVRPYRDPVQGQPGESVEDRGERRRSGNQHGDLFSARRESAQRASDSVSVMRKDHSTTGPTVPLGAPRRQGLRKPWTSWHRHPPRHSRGRSAQGQLLSSRGRNSRGVLLVSVAVERLQVLRIEQTKYKGSRCAPAEVGDQKDPDSRP
jgi:hypothetical protein